jgi:hypothetical protein
VCGSHVSRSNRAEEIETSENDEKGPYECTKYTSYSRLRRYHTHTTCMYARPRHVCTGGWAHGWVGACVWWPHHGASDGVHQSANRQSSIKVAQQGLVTIQKHVLWLDVTVHEAVLRVEICESSSDATGHGHSSRRRESFSSELVQTAVQVSRRCKGHEQAHWLVWPTTANHPDSLGNTRTQQDVGRGVQVHVSKTCGVGYKFTSARRAVWGTSSRQQENATERARGANMIFE